MFSWDTNFGPREFLKSLRISRKRLGHLAPKCHLFISLVYNIQLVLNPFPFTLCR